MIVTILGPSFFECPCNPKFVGAYITTLDIGFFIRINDGGESNFICKPIEEVCLRIGEDLHCLNVSREQTQIISTRIPDERKNFNIILYIPRLSNCNSDCLILNVNRTSEYTV